MRAWRVSYSRQEPEKRYRTTGVAIVLAKDAVSAINIVVAKFEGGAAWMVSDLGEVLNA